MPVHFFSQEDHERLNRFPDEVASHELDAHFLLSAGEFRATRDLRGSVNQLGFALQLCGLRFLGYLPDDLMTIPGAVVKYVADQLGINPSCLSDYGKRPRTRQDHQRLAQSLLGYRRASPMDALELESWLLTRAQEHDKPSLLFELACEHLRHHRVVRIGTQRLAQMVAAARARAWMVGYEKLRPLLSPERIATLDSLLEVDQELGCTRLAWLQQTPTSNEIKQILAVLEKIDYLQARGVAGWKVGSLNPNRLKFLAHIGARSTNQYLQRIREERRYPILIAFLYEALYTFTDEVIEMVDQCLWELHGEARRSFEKDRLRAMHKVNEKLRTLRDLGRVLLDPSVDDIAVRVTAFSIIKPEQLVQSLDETNTLIRPNDDAYVDYFARHYPSVRKIAKKLLSTLSFRSRGSDNGLMQALDMVKALYAGTIRKLPANAPTGFIPDTWLSYVVEGGINRRYYELAVLWVLRQGLRSGDVYTLHSRRFTDIESCFIPKGEWLVKRREAAELTRTPLVAETRLTEREIELIKVAARVEALITDKTDLREEKGRLILSPLEAEGLPPHAQQLGNLIGERLPKLDITDLLMEVDGWTGFSAVFTHLMTKQLPEGDIRLHVYASLLAQACNLGFKQMATSSELPYRRLLWCNTWYVREETLRDATTVLVNHHHRLPLSRVWGGGMLSSSDGQRFPVKGKLRKARALPKYFGYGKGVTFYTWSSDQFSQYGSKAIPSTVRDATYVLDEILGNETDLNITEHTTDTAGYTELIFALFDLLGLKFSPRIRDLKDQQLYRTDGLDLNTYPRLKPHLSGIISAERVCNHWDDMLRLAGSLKLGYATASLVVQKLQAYPRQHPLLRALQEYGRLPKTLHILNWYSDALSRRRINRQINKGEALHQLRSELVFGDHGEIRAQDDVQLSYQVGCLNLVTNAIVLWNTVYYEKVLKQLKKEGYLVDDEDVKHIWPTRRAHINIYGRYYFDREVTGKRQGFRELRSPDSKD